jgi:hypothetical protein
MAQFVLFIALNLQIVRILFSEDCFRTASEDCFSPRFVGNYTQVFSDRETKSECVECVEWHDINSTN